ncbi:hypothetical protein DdX_06696 [Ditylenchus destructor]|uniref:Uncharacterized protein n=1 Tax=Ditylenchus destructor TaxID=166010 RepID=A0AAD4N8A9_9BILA|nr:hypothetical protein DdX_06696 [Ditylenchus destructor]
MESLCFIVLLLFPITVSAQITASLNDAPKTESPSTALILESNGSSVTAAVSGLTLLSAVNASAATGIPLLDVALAGNSLQPSIAITLEAATGGSVATQNSSVPTVIASGSGSTNPIALPTLEVQISAGSQSPQERSNTVDSTGNPVALSTILSVVNSSPAPASDGPQSSAVSLLTQTDVTSGPTQPSSASPSVTGAQKVRRKRAAAKRKTQKQRGSKHP